MRYGLFRPNPFKYHKSVTQTSRTIIIGFTYKGGNDTTAKVPIMDPINVKVVIYELEKNQPCDFLRM